MTLPASGPLSLSDIQTEFGGSNPISLSEYYAGGGLVPAGTSGTYGAVPSSGAISVQNFYGTSNYIPVYIEELFQPWLYNGNGGANTITNGINLSGNGGLIWTKSRAETGNNWFVDTARGINFGLYSNATNAQFSDPGTFTSFNSTGYSMNNSYGDLNSGQPGRTYVSWTFREQPKFFDIVTYTGNDVSARLVPHNLASVPGCIFIKRLDAASDWYGYTRINSATYSRIFLNSDAVGSNDSYDAAKITSTAFNPETISGNSILNTAGRTYVAYLFAHNAGGFGLTGTDNVISCGSYDGNNSTNGPTITLGYEPQFLMIKRLSGGTGNWQMIDNMRGFSTGTAGTYTSNGLLRANQNIAEATNGYISPLSTGFKVITDNTEVNALGIGSTYFYMAIRRGPMKVPTVATKVFSPNAVSTDTSPVTTNFPVDLLLENLRTGFINNTLAFSRLQGGSPATATSSSAAEFGAGGSAKFQSNTSVTPNVLGSGSIILYNFGRAPNFFDVVCYTGTGSAQNVTHNLKVAPELVIIKSRSNGGSGYGWVVGSSVLPSWGRYLQLNTTDAVNPSNNAGPFNNTAPTSSVLTVNTWTETNGSGATYVAYLFASLAGISKIGLVTHAEPTTVVCGFVPRFVMIKSTQNTGTNDWFVFDSARGITAGNDPYISFNLNTAENTPFGAADLIDLTGSGFIMNGFGGGTYLFLAIA